MSTLTVHLSDHDIQRIAEAVAALMEDRPHAKGWYSVSDAATYTSLTEEAIRVASKRGKLQGVKGHSGRLAFRREALDRFMGGEIG